MEYSAEKGVCMFAYNNDQLDYGHFALLAAKQAKQHLNNIPVCLITDEGTWAWLNESHPKEMVDANIDEVVITAEENDKNVRKHYDSPYAHFQAQFTNGNKHKIYEYSPFNKTLLIDIDYMIRSDFLSGFWEVEGVSMFSNSYNMRNERLHGRERFLYDAGVPMWWSTVIMFDRSELSQLFFNTWAHVAENYSFYQYLYNFPGKLFRTDYCVSIVIHIMNGMVPGDVIKDFGGAPLMNMMQTDDLVEVRDDEWIFLANDSKDEWKNILSKSKDQDVHIMNKRALHRQWNAIMGVADGKE